MLEEVAKAFNEVKKQNFDEALRLFGEMSFLPLKAGSDLHEKVKAFALSVHEEVKTVAYEAIIAAARVGLIISKDYRKD
eukprot:CAMPEP_0202980712 /NCGR_PEP_ID=MMETSP1396-20130829/86586_1 /ASSEMBLY_ACC=CAM_ASM_000872 /TAXON_ID= /ORGANISM="Pseudokeronopsis sp., Strain Brazil" /LENGTH=78 /DNA_ID=CAMNT_0049720859 /DNA_START=758 /DNA_END=994 /DNA_ORIENTATION=+